jgi:NhaP-type Na+/H+ or K+/H+ antiporter
VDPYFVVLAVLGVAAMAAAVLPRLLDGRPLSTSIVFLAIGMAVFALPIGLEGPQVGADDEVAERLTEFIVIVSLMGAGLKLRRPVGWRSWSTTWRLLGITMPLTIAGLALLALGPLGLPIASAILLGAVLAPTDPVLASDVQVEGTDEEDAQHEVRFALTSEAGLNDALAFPFTNLAIAVAAGGSWFAGRVAEDLVLKLAVGLAAGYVFGRVVAWLTFRFPSRSAFARTSEGFVAIGATLAVYGATELLHGYGFLAVVVAAITIRHEERDHEYQQVLHDYAETTERLASVLFLLLLGGAVVDGALSALTWGGVVVAVLLVFVIRPVAGWIGLLGTETRRDERAAIAFFGIRGMGTVYYLSHAATEEAFPAAAEIWSTAILAIVVSIIVHGATATPVLRWVDRRSEEREQQG